MRHAINNMLRQTWQTSGWLSTLLWPVSAALGLLLRLQQGLYALGVLKTHRLPVPVVVVGNVMVGGVGKTPIVMALVAHLQQQGWQVGVVSRGYGRSAQARQTHPICEVNAHSSAQDVGDEPLLIHTRCRVPVWVGAQRVLAARALLAAHPQVQVIVSDDGLQHTPLARDLELCVFDERGLGNGRLLPAGPLREAWPRTSSVPCLVLNTASAALPFAPEAFKVKRRLSFTAQQADGTQRPLQHWQQHPACAVAGIAKPEAFFKMLQDEGVQLSSTQALPDHASAAHLAQAVHPFAKQDVLCTEKDAVKLWPTLPQAWAVPLQVVLPEALLSSLNSALQHACQNKSGLAPSRT